MRPNRFALILSVFAAGLGAAAASAETTLCTGYVTAVPTTINASGNWCLQGNLATAATTGAAITIAASDVVLDLNGFRLANTATDTALTTIGVYAWNLRNITIRNGTIRGFYRGIQITDSGSSAGHLVEGIRADSNKLMGILVGGKASIVRNCQVAGTTGSTATADVNATGIQVGGSGARVANNDVTDTVAMGLGSARAIAVSLDGVVVEGNRVANATASATSTGIKVLSGDDALVVGNDIANMGFGVYFSGHGKYRDNLTSGVTTPYAGGVDAGNNQ